MNKNSVPYKGDKALIYGIQCCEFCNRLNGRVVNCTTDSHPRLEDGSIINLVDFGGEVLVHNGYRIVRVGHVLTKHLLKIRDPDQDLETVEKLEDVIS